MENLILYTVKALAIELFKPINLIVILVVCAVFFYKNTKVANMQKKISGERINSPLELTLSQLALCMIIGGVSAVTFNFLGIGFRQNSGVQTLFIISIILMFVKPRFGCFSYGAAVLGGISIVYTHFIARGEIGGPLRVDIVALMTLVGILHIIEGLLVIIDGRRGAIPVFTKRKGMIFGGYALNRYWLIPITMIFFLQQSSMFPGSEVKIHTPNWWPLIQTPDTRILMLSSVMVMMTFYGMLNYRGITFTKSKGEKTREAGSIIIVYGALVCFVAQIARIGVLGQIIVIITVPILHEMMLSFQKRCEKKRKPKFYSFPGRICVIEVVPFSVAHRAGIRPGDIIRKINGRVVETEGEIYKMKDFVEMEVELLIVKKHRELAIKIEKDLNKGLGILVVPVSILNKSNFKKILEEKKKAIHEKI